MAEWQIRIDVGGTFTDGWARSPGGEEFRCKVLSSGVLRFCVDSCVDGWVECARSLSPHSAGLEGFRTLEGLVVLESVPNAGRLRFSRAIEAGTMIELSSGEESAVVAARLLSGTAPGMEFPTSDLRVATTRGTNALLEGKGTPVDLFTTAGFESLLEVRDQRRPDIFELTPKIAIPVTRRVIGIPGRSKRNGEIIDELETDVLNDIIPGESVAIAMIHADRVSEHEAEVARILRRKGCENPSVSHELAPVIRLWPRMETTVANAYLTPIMSGFIGNIEAALPETPVSLMTSAGQLKSVAQFRPIDSLLSGPAGGVAGATALARASGMERVLTFDMGGTSTDVARVTREPGYRYEQEIGPVKVLAPAIRIETVAAGGGSICHWRNGGLEVGPESAGSNPGPACYGRGGPLTITDVNLLLGLMDESKAGIPMDRKAAEIRLDELCLQIGNGPNPAELLRGMRQIAINHMAEALRLVSTREGYDCRDHTLVAFGGAGPQHACALARELGMKKILIPGDAGLLSAWGLHQAGDRELLTRQILRLLDDSVEEVIGAVSEGRTIHRCLFELRLKGQDSCLEIETTGEASPNEIRRAFDERYLALYGYARPERREIEWVALRVELEGSARDAETEEFSMREFLEVDRIEQDVFSTLVLEKGWRVFEGSRGSLRLEWEGQREGAAGNLEVVEAELYRRRFEGVVEEMGELLRRAALSTNIKERLDFSCALLDSKGFLVVNAPHIPVHLGASGLCVRRVSADRKWKEGENIVVNHPAFGGSHLPDVTVISPVFVEEELVGFVANRAHHAEIGGKSPGSMPPDATCLAEEGIVIPPTSFEEIDEAFFEGSRSPADNFADLIAQVSANRHGVQEVAKLVSESSVAAVSGHMRGLYERSSSILRASLKGFPRSQGGVITLTTVRGFKSACSMMKS